jgi:hypothetical protein
MAEFNPAPHDKYAESAQVTPAKPSNHRREELERGLEDTFPASDPVSVLQPAPSVYDVATDVRDEASRTNNPS